MYPHAGGESDPQPEQSEAALEGKDAAKRHTHHPKGENDEGGGLDEWGAKAPQQGVRPTGAQRVSDDVRGHPRQALGDQPRDVARRVARFKQPETIEFVADLPTLPTGKVRRRLLRDL